MTEPLKTDFGLMPFLFGNIDDKGELVDDILDEECKKHLNSLSQLGLSSLLAEVISSDEIKPEDDASIDNDYSVSHLIKSPSAEDYWEENEYYRDEEKDVDTISRVVSTESNETDIALDVKSSECGENTTLPPLVPVLKSASPPCNSKYADEKKLETPLAAMLPEKYRNVDVREFFPEFRFGKVTRISNLLRYLSMS
mgnify:CR=1 FL=1